MGSIFAEKTLYGSDAVITNPAKSGRASGSASCGMRTGSCDFIFGTVPSSAVQDRLGIRDRTAVASFSLEKEVRIRSPVYSAGERAV
jgi:hypothetical protein